TSASDDSRTSSARARVNAPSSALGQRAYSASATIAPSSASPRNSSRSLFGVPALRWVSACASRPGARNAWPAKATPSRSVRVTGPREVLLGVEPADHVQVGDQRLAHFVLHGHEP